MNMRNSSQHISKQFDNELESIRERVLTMGGLVEQQLATALKSLTESEIELAEQVQCVIEHPELGRDMARAGLRIIDNNRGAIKRVCHILREQLEWSRSTID